MPLTVRIDSSTADRLDRLAARRGISRSEVVRDALARVLDEEESAPERSFYDDIATVVGCVNTGGMGLSEKAGDRFRDILKARREPHSH